MFSVAISTRGSPWGLALRQGKHQVRRVFSPSVSDRETKDLEPISDGVHEIAVLNAAASGDEPALRAAIDNGGSANARTRLDVTALMLASRKEGGHRCVQILIDARARSRRWHPNLDASTSRRPIVAFGASLARIFTSARAFCVRASVACV